MNEVGLIGRLIKDPEVRDTAGGSKVATYTLAVDRYNIKDRKNEADFIRVVSFGRTAAFVEKFLRKGTPILVHGSIKTGSYVNKDGKKVYTTDIWADRHEFLPVNSKKNDEVRDDDFFTKLVSAPDDEDFIKIPDDVEDEGLPFN